MTTKKTIAEQFPHYFKNVEHLKVLDVYRVLELYNVRDNAIGHAIKKLLCAGGRGLKDQKKDIKEAIVSLTRWMEMQDEDFKSDAGDKAKWDAHMHVQSVKEKVEEEKINYADIYAFQNRAGMYGTNPKCGTNSKLPVHTVKLNPGWKVTETGVINLLKESTDGEPEGEFQEALAGVSHEPVISVKTKTRFDNHELFQLERRKKQRRDCLDCNIPHSRGILGSDRRFSWADRRQSVRDTEINFDGVEKVKTMMQKMILDSSDPKLQKFYYDRRIFVTTDSIHRRRMED